MLQEHAIAAPNPQNAVLARTADMLKNETLDVLRKACKEPNTVPLSLKNPTVEERLHEEIVRHLTKLGDINEQEQRILISMNATQDKQEKKTLKHELKEARFRLNLVKIQLHITQQAEMLRETTLFLQKEKNRKHG